MKDSNICFESHLADFLVKLKRNLGKNYKIKKLRNIDLNSLHYLVTTRPGYKTLRFHIHITHLTPSPEELADSYAEWIIDEVGEYAEQELGIK